jgi:hypothetical protein
MSLHAQQDRFDKILELAPETIACIESLNLHQETIAAVMLPLATTRSPRSCTVRAEAEPDAEAEG